MAALVVIPSFLGFVVRSRVPFINASTNSKIDPRELLTSPNICNFY